MKLRTILAAPIAIVAAGLLLSACGQGSQVAGTATISAAAAVDSTAAKPVASLAETGALGQVLVGANGHTLYGFTDDANGTSTCFDACATAWPAVTVQSGFLPPTGVDPALVTTVDRPDGSKQLKIGKWPVYFYAGDGAPGSADGQGVGGKWFAVGADGTLVKGDKAGAATPSAAASAAAAPAAKPAAPAPASLAQAGALGQVLVGANGHTLYGFTDDANGTSTCFDACATAWPAVTVDAGFTPPAGVDPALVTTVDRPDGSKQLKVGKWPLYFYVGDGAPGETNGEGVGTKWFAVGADGKLVKGPADAAAPAPAAAAAPAPAPAPAAAPAAQGPVVDLAQVGNLGEVMVGANGHTLYAFTDDPAGQTTCFDACAKAWPPLTVPADFTISDELQASGAKTIQRPDGSLQLVMGKWALYYYAGDNAPGDANGQGLNGKWFAIDATCHLVKTAA